MWCWRQSRRTPVCLGLTVRPGEHHLRASGGLGSQNSGAARLHHGWPTLLPHSLCDVGQPLLGHGQYGEQMTSRGNRGWRGASRKREKGVSRRTCDKYEPVAGTSGGDVLTSGPVEDVSTSTGSWL